MLIQPIDQLPQISELRDTQAHIASGGTRGYAARSASDQGPLVSPSSVLIHHPMHPAKTA